MIDKQTIAFISFLNDLARDSRHGIRPFSTATNRDKEGLLYDDNDPIEVCDDGDYSQTSYPLVADRLIDELHHDIISTWTEIWAEDGIQVTVMVEKMDGNESEPAVCVTTKNDDFCIAVHDGIWYNC